jgi:predicted MFS family arabinose efflux permease
MAVARAINTAGMSLVMSFLAVHVVTDRGYDAWMYGACALLANVAQSMTAAWAGELSDRIGRRALITGSLMVRSGVILLLGVQILYEAPLWSLALNFVASSALRGCFEPVAYALVSDVVRPEQRIAAFGVQRMGTNAGWAFGPALGGLLAQWMPYGRVFFISAAGLLVAAWITLDVPESRRGAEHLERVRLRDALRDALHEPVLLTLLIGSFLFSLIHTQMFSTLAIYGSEVLALSKRDIGLLYMVNGVGVVLLQFSAIRVIERIGLHRALILSALGYVVGDLLFGAAVGYWTAALAIAAVTVSEVVFAPAHQTAAAEISDPERRGRTFGVVAFAQNLGVACAPLLGGVLLDTLEPRYLWVVIAGCALTLTATMTVFARLRRALSS